jgi:hypothetical protein
MAGEEAGGLQAERLKKTAAGQLLALDLCTILIQSPE